MRSKVWVGVWVWVWVFVTELKGRTPNGTEYVALAFVDDNGGVCVRFKVCVGECGCGCGCLSRSKRAAHPMARSTWQCLLWMIMEVCVCAV